MLNRLIRLSLAHRAIVLIGAGVLLFFGLKSLTELPVEVLPDLTKPTVTILTEAPGLAPEEVETLVTVPIESALMGVTGVSRLRTTSDVALCLTYVEFDWGTDIYVARRLVQERLQAVELPDGILPYMTPVASLMGEIMLVGMRSTDGETDVRDLRVMADWDVRLRLQKIPGVAEVLSMGGGVKQLHVQPDPDRLRAMGVSLDELREAIANAARNTTGGFLTSGTQEIMMRNLAMSTDPQEIAGTVIKVLNDRPIAIKDVAEVVWDIEPMRGDAAVNGTRGVILSVTKAPGFDTLDLTRQIEDEIGKMQDGLPEGVELVALFRQADFIDHAVGNLEEAIRDGIIMVAIVLFLFLLNLRTTFITLMAMPLSFAVTILVFRLWDISVNSMTLGGLAVAIGMVVDDAIVDVENVFRRLRENASRDEPEPRLEVIARASAEVRNSILYATLFIILVFLPLLGLSGVEGRLFTPIAVATIVSMSASFVISLTVIPVLCSLLLRPKEGLTHKDGRVVQGLKWLYRNTWLRLALDQPVVVLALSAALVAGAISLIPSLGRGFLPPFREETALVAMTAAPGTSLTEMNELSEAADRLLLSIPEVRKVGRRLGRAERGDHVVPVSTVEFDIDFVASDRTRQQVLDDIRARVRSIPGTFAILSGPLADRVGHMLSGVSAKVAIKVIGPELDEIRRIGEQIQAIAREIPGLESAAVEQQAFIPQLRIEANRDRATAYGITPGKLNAQLSALIGGEKLGELYEGQRRIDLVMRLPESWRESPQKLARLFIDSNRGAPVPLELVADLREAHGPNVIKRENTNRRFVVKINPTSGDLSGLVEELKRRVNARVKKPTGYDISFEGEYVAQKEASRDIAIMSSLVLLIIAFLLFSYFRSPVFVAQVLCDIPLALIGGLTFTWWMTGTISIASLIGFIAVAGIAARNSVMMLSHYLHLMRHEGESFSREMIARGAQERLVPVLMTALSAGIALIPLVRAADAPGKEILHPVAVVIVGGLVTSTILGLGVTPAVFRLFGKRAAESAVASHAPASD